MAQTPTNQIPLGFQAPEFNLPDTITGNEFNFNDLRGERATVVAFICNHCPFVIHIKDELVRIMKDYMPKGVGFVLISSNDIVNYPEDSPEKMKVFAEINDFPVPYLYDESQEVAKAYDAACTPDFSVFDSGNACVYRGRMDGSRPGNAVAVDGRDLRSVLNSVLENKQVTSDQMPSIGCNIKWKPALS